jgi:hypothetical protein
MADSWLQRLIVRGSAPDVAAFTAAARGDGRPYYLTVKPRLRTQRLSFETLKALMPVGVARRVAPEPEEPWDLVVEQRRLKDGTVTVTYKFQLSEFECESLMIAVSKRYPRLCFVLATVAPSVDQQSSMFIHNGQARSWDLSNRRKTAILAKVPQETADNADDVTQALAEADWAMMDEVVDHWMPKATQVMTRLRRRRRTAHQRRSPAARRRR